MPRAATRSRAPRVEPDGSTPTLPWELVVAPARPRLGRPLPVPPRWTTVPSPIGELLLAADGEALTGLWMLPHPRWEPDTAGWVRDDGLALFAETGRQLAAYFAGELREFALPLAAAGSEFQRRVWDALLAIPYGATRTYGAIAQQLDFPAGARAVGAANGRNPISVIVPCHRVIGAGGDLIGYGGGLDRKAWLLSLERSGRPQHPLSFARVSAVAR